MDMAVGSTGGARRSAVERGAAMNKRGLAAATVRSAFPRGRLIASRLALDLKALVMTTKYMPIHENCVFAPSR